MASEVLSAENIAASLSFFNKLRYQQLRFQRAYLSWMIRFSHHGAEAMRFKIFLRRASRLSRFAAEASSAARLPEGSVAAMLPVNNACGARAWGCLADTLGFVGVVK